MEITEAASEERLAEFLPEVEKEAAGWILVHINLAQLHEQLLGAEVLSQQSLDKVKQVGLQMAGHLMEWGVKDCEGKLFTFGDSDVICLIKRNGEQTEAVIERIKQEFQKNQLQHLLHIDAMKDRLASIVELSTRKRASAADLRLKSQAALIAENLLTHGETDSEMTRDIQKRRSQRDGRSCILIVEDDFLTRGMMTTLLKQDYHIVQARDAREGIVQYIQNAPDMVFLDIHLPDLNGKELLKRFKTIDPMSHIVMLSADSVHGNIVAARQNGAAGFICKPFSKEKVLEYVNKCPAHASDSRSTRALGWKKMDAS